MKTLFPKQNLHIPKKFVVDASNKTLGRLCTEVSKLLKGKETSLYTPGVDQGNFVIVLNSNKILVTGNKENEKFYYKNSQRPGSLKIETFKDLKKRLPGKISEKAIWGMLPKGVLGRKYFKRLYVYSNEKVIFKKSTKNIEQQENYLNDWININF